MALIDELIKRLERQRERKIQKYLSRKELGGIGAPTSVDADWEGPNLEITWADPTKKWGSYMDTKIVIYNTFHKQRVRRVDYAQSNHYSYTLDKNVADAHKLGESKPSPRVYVEIRHRTEGKIESDPAYRSCENTVPDAPTIVGWDWDEPVLHVEIETDGLDIDYPDARLVIP